MSKMSQNELKLLQQAEQKARLVQQNKDAARVHLLAVQIILSRAPRPEKSTNSYI
jgi:hypothetical protein